MEGDRGILARGFSRGGGEQWVDVDAREVRKQRSLYERRSTNTRKQVSMEQQEFDIELINSGLAQAPWEFLVASCIGGILSFCCICIHDSWLYHSRLPVFIAIVRKEVHIPSEF